MTIETLLGRIQEIEHAILNMTAQLHALHGQKAEATHWMQSLSAPVPDPDKPLEDVN